MALPVKQDLSVHAPQGLKKTLFHLGLKGPLLNPLNTAEIGVHAGFQFALNSVWDRTSTLLEGYRAANPTAPVFFTGHSLGAALATLAIARFRGGKAALYTFGSPVSAIHPFARKFRREPISASIDLWTITIW